MRRYAALLVASAIALSGCGKGTPEPAENTTHTAPASPQPVVNTPPAPPPHRYQMVDHGTYGYEPALSEDDIRRGTAAKALLMMRYEGFKNDEYVILLLGDDPNDTSEYVRVSCQAPCQFAKSQTIVDGSVAKTETLRVTTNSIVGAMLEDAVNGVLTPYAEAQQNKNIPIPAQPAQNQAQPVAAQPAAVAQPASATQQAPAAPTQPGNAAGTTMWIGPLDANLRSCPGASAECPSIAVAPKRTQVEVDTSSIKDVVGSNGQETSWAKVTFTGLYCDPATLDPQLGCTSPVPSNGPVTGWINYQLLRPTSGNP